MAKAERIKVEEGSVILGNSRPGETIVLKDETGFAGKEVEREMLNTIIHCRVRESFELLKKQLEEEDNLPVLGAGVMLTGGCSLLKGINHLAEEVLGVPVHLTHAQTVSGLTSAFENPQFSTAIGLIKYAEAMQPERPAGLFSKLRKKFSIFGLW
jgi:cell division protein FtsA